MIFLEENKEHFWDLIIGKDSLNRTKILTVKENMTNDVVLKLRASTHQKATR